MKNNLKGSIILIAAAIIWGTAFVFQAMASKSGMPPIFFNAFRSLIGSVFIAVMLFVISLKDKLSFLPETSEEKALTLKAGLICGTVLAITVNLQQVAIDAYTRANMSSEARGGFLTALYILFVPLIYTLFGRKIRPIIWISILIAFVGVYLLCMKGGFTGLCLGDLLMLGCAFTCAVHIIFVDKFASKVNGIRLSGLQFLVCGLISLIVGIIFEGNLLTMRILKDAIIPILYLGVISSGVAYTLQIIGQKYAEPSIASICMSLESVFAAIGGWVISGSALSVREIAGCIVLFTAIIICQLPPIKFKKA